MPSTNRRPDSDDDEDVNEDSDEESDPGTNWFSEYNVPDKTLDFLTSPDFPLSPENLSPEELQGIQILDLGTGNGSMLRLLARKGRFPSHGMVGVDYSALSVELARRLTATGSHSDSERGIRFVQWDILDRRNDAILPPLSSSSASEGRNGTADGERLEWFPYDKHGFDLVHDKGTFDAVSLSAETEPVDGEEGSSPARICVRYPLVAARLVRPGGFLLVSSCNWTEDELIRWFVPPDGSTSLQVWGRIEYPRFRFGGSEGQGVCSVCFRRQG